MRCVKYHNQYVNLVLCLMRPFLLQEWISLLAYLLTFSSHLKGCDFTTGSVAGCYLLFFNNLALSCRRLDQWPLGFGAVGCIKGISDLKRQASVGIAFSTGIIWYRRWCAQYVIMLICIWIGALQSQVVTSCSFATAGLPQVGNYWSIWCYVKVVDPVCRL